MTGNTLLTWQVVDSKTATVADLLQAPIVFINGHKAPEFADRGTAELCASTSTEGGFIFAEACCGSADFDQGFRTLMKEMFPEQGGCSFDLLPDDHPIWRARHRA